MMNMATSGEAAGITLADQELAGLIMIVACPLFYVSAGVYIAAKWLFELGDEALPTARGDGRKRLVSASIFHDRHRNFILIVDEAEREACHNKKGKSSQHKLISPADRARLTRFCLYLH